MAERKKGKGSRRSRQEWRTLLAKFGDSSEGVETFCRRETISAASFYRWRKLLGKDGDHGETARTVTAPAFVDLGRLGAAGPTRPRLDLTLDLGDGLVLHLVRH